MNFLKSFLLVFTMVMLSNWSYASQKKTNHLFDEIKTIGMNRDSVELFKLEEEINKDSIKLVGLKSQLEEKMKIKEETAAIAQKLADENNKAAKRLSNNPLEKKLAKKADNLSSEARSSAKSARTAANALDSLNRSIISLERKIAKQQTKLSKLKVAS